MSSTARRPERNRGASSVHGRSSRYADRGDRDRPRVHRLVHETRGSATYARRRGDRRAEGRRRRERDVVAGLQQVKAQAEQRVSTRVSRGRFRLARGGVLECLGMNPTSCSPASAARRPRTATRGPSGPGRAHASGSSARCAAARSKAIPRYATGPSSSAMERSRTIAGKVSHLDGQMWTPTRSCPSSSSRRRALGVRGVPVLRLASSRLGAAGQPDPVAGENFGCAPRASTRRGAAGLWLPALVAPSYADIFYSNCTKTGLLRSCSARRTSALARVGEGEIDLDAQEVRFGGPPAHVVSFEIRHEIRRRLLAGLDDIG